MNNGSYAGMSFSDKTSKEIVAYLKHNNIPNPVSEDKLHTTLMFSRKFLPEYTSHGVYKSEHLLNSKNGGLSQIKTIKSPGV